jgi:serine/threonine protein kinase
MHDIVPPQLPERFVVERLLAKGFSGSIWLVTDKITKTTMIAKVVEKSSAAPETSLYIRHLQQVFESLPTSAYTYLLPSIEIGETETHYFQIYPYLDGVDTLERIAHRGLSIHSVLKIIGQVATGLSALHTHGFVHGDVKPSNILIKKDATLTARLIDLGMIQSQGDEGALIIGTYAYLHPAFHSNNLSMNSVRGWIPASISVGPYVDLYALGIVTLEVLSGSREPPKIISVATIALALASHRELADAHLREQVASLIFMMLSVKPTEPSIDAKSIASVANHISSQIVVGKEPPHVPVHYSDSPESAIITAQADVIKVQTEIINWLRSTADSFVAATVSLIASKGVLNVASGPTQDDSIAAEMDRVFQQSLRRARTTWRITLLMTVFVFALLAGMIALGIGFGLSTGKNQWAIVLGGATVPMIVGVLIWKPYDRLFRATILTQQLEMVHVQTVAAFRSTSILEERINICQMAFNQLSVLLHDSNLGPSGRSESKPRKRPKRS